MEKHYKVIEGVKTDWYKENIEEPIRDIVKYLRNNGINTECSCGHEMYIQCQYIADGNIKELHDLLCCYLYKNNRKKNYEINVKYKVEDGHITLGSLDIVFDWRDWRN